jgi:hypothetical protein
MVKLLFSVILEAIVGISLSGLILAVVVPLVHRYRPLQAADGDIVPTAVIVAVILCVTAAVLFRPGSAINRWIRR